MAMTIAAIPELIDRIIDHLHDDEEALRTCALVARSWLSASRYHLVYSLAIASEPAFYSLVHFLDRNPGIGQKARELALQLVWDEPTPWIRPPLDLFPLAAHLPNLYYLALSDDWSRYGDRNRSVVLGGFQSVVSLGISFSTFYTVADALELLRSFPLLEQLSLQFIDIGDITSVMEDAGPPLGLVGLRVEVSDDVHEMSWHAIAPFLLSLETTSLSVPLSSEEGLLLILAHCQSAGDRLAEIRLDTNVIGHSTAAEMPWATLVLPPMPNLATLYIGRVRLLSDVSARAFAHSLQQLFLRRPTEHPNLSRVVVHMGPEPPIARTIYFWTPVVRALEARADAAICHFVLVMHDRGSERRTLRFVHAAVPALVDGGIIRVVSDATFRDTE